MSGVRLLCITGWSHIDKRQKILHKWITFLAIQPTCMQLRASWVITILLLIFPPHQSFTWTHPAAGRTFNMKWDSYIKSDMCRCKCTCRLCGRRLKLVLGTTASYVKYCPSQWPAPPPRSPSSSHWPICGVRACRRSVAGDIVFGNATLSGWPSSNHGKGNSHHRQATHGSHQRCSGKLMASRNTHEWSEFRRRSPRWGSVRGCECARHLSVFDVCAGVSCYSPSDS